MESTEEKSGLLHRILPPRLEDAGLEDPALPPESIHEAFLKAAAAVKSSAASIFSGKENADDCLNDPWPTTEGNFDAVVGIEPENNPAGPCTVEKGNNAVTDKLSVGGDDDELEKVVDELVVGEEVKLGEDGEACVDGFQGLDIKEKDDVKKIKEEDEEKEKEKKPTLVEDDVEQGGEVAAAKSNQERAWSETHVMDESLFMELTQLPNNLVNACYVAPPNIFSDGLWGDHFFGRTPLRSAFPVFQLQVIVIFAVTQICQFFLKLLDFPEFISQMMAGLILGPAIQLDSLDIYKKMLFPYGSQDILATISSIGYAIFIFITAVQMDLSMVTRTGQKAWTIAILGLVAPMFFFPLAPFVLDTISASFGNHPNEIPLVVVAQIVVSFSAVSSLLNELQILNSELGRLALSAGLVSDIVSSTIAGISSYIPMFNTENRDVVLMGIATFFAFAILVPLICRPTMFWIIKHTKDGRPVDDGYVYIIIAMIFALGWIATKLKQDFTLGAFVLGLSVPEGPPLGSALVKKLQVFGKYLFLPLYVTCGAMKADFSLPFEPGKSLAITALIGLSHLVKIIACMVPSLICKIPLKDSLALALILNVKGVVDVGIFSGLYNANNFTGQTYAVMTVSIMVIGCLVKWSVRVLYDPSRKYAGYQKRNIMSLRPGSELRILACIHKHNHISPITDVLDIISPTTENPFTVDALHLIELVGRTSPVFISHHLQKSFSDSHKSYSDNVIIAFDLYEHDNRGVVTAHTYTAISPPTLMHEDICQLALDKVASIIILPFHRRWSNDGSVEYDDKNIRSLNCTVLEVAPCSIGILVTRSSLQNNMNIRLAMVYLGGKDDREALCLAKRAVLNPRINLVVYHLAAKEHLLNCEHLEDMEVLEEVTRQYHDAQNVRCQKILVSDGVETSAVLRNIANEHDFFIVGRKHDLNLPQVEGLADWSEYTELGVIGDLLASPDFESQASVLVVQQQVK